MSFKHNHEDDYIPIKLEGWNGKFEKNTEPTTGVPCSRTEACSYNRNHTDSDRFYGNSTSPTSLPPQWSGTFAVDPNDVRMKQERNYSDTKEFHEYTNEPETLPPDVRVEPDKIFCNSNNFIGRDKVLPPQWSGKFQLDSTDVRVKPDKIFSDHRNFIGRNKVFEN